MKASTAADDNDVAAAANPSRHQASEQICSAWLRGSTTGHPTHPDAIARGTGRLLATIELHGEPES